MKIPIVDFNGLKRPDLIRISSCVKSTRMMVNTGRNEDMKGSYFLVKMRDRFVSREALVCISM